MAERSRESAHLTTALVHLYRGEVARADAWRARLDNTTNWALTTAAAVVSYGLSSPSASHAVFLIGMFLVMNFLGIEARRYRAWDVYLRRVRLLEIGLYAPLLRDEPPETRHLQELASMLSSPRIVIPFWAALGQRIKRAYGPVLVVLVLAWLVKLFLHQPALSLGGYVARMRVAFLPGWVVLVAVALTYATLSAVLAWSLFASPPNTELLSVARRPRPLRAAFERRPPPRPGREDSPLNA